MSRIADKTVSRPPVDSPDRQWIRREEGHRRLLAQVREEVSVVGDVPVPAAVESIPALEQPRADEVRRTHRVERLTIEELHREPHPDHQHDGDPDEHCDRVRHSRQPLPRQAQPVPRQAQPVQRQAPWSALRSGRSELVVDRGHGAQSRRWSPVPSASRLPAGNIATTHRVRVLQNGLSSISGAKPVKAAVMFHSMGKETEAKSRSSCPDRVPRPRPALRRTRPYAQPTGRAGRDHKERIGPPWGSSSQWGSWRFSWLDPPAIHHARRAGRGRARQQALLVPETPRRQPTRLPR